MPCSPERWRKGKAVGAPPFGQTVESLDLDGGRFPTQSNTLVEQQRKVPAGSCQREAKEDSDSLFCQARELPGSSSLLFGKKDDHCSSFVSVANRHTSLGSSSPNQKAKSLSVLQDDPWRREGMEENEEKEIVEERGETKEDNQSSSSPLLLHHAEGDGKETPDVLKRDFEEKEEEEEIESPKMRTDVREQKEGGIDWQVSQNADVDINTIDKDGLDAIGTERADSPIRERASTLPSPFSCKLEEKEEGTSGGSLVVGEEEEGEEGICSESESLEEEEGGGGGDQEVLTDEGHPTEEEWEDRRQKEERGEGKQGEKAPESSSLSQKVSRGVSPLFPPSLPDPTPTPPNAPSAASSGDKISGGGLSLSSSPSQAVSSQERSVVARLRQRLQAERRQSLRRERETATQMEELRQMLLTLEGEAKKAEEGRRRGESWRIEAERAQREMRRMQAECQKAASQAGEAASSVEVLKKESDGLAKSLSALRSKHLSASAELSSKRAALERTRIRLVEVEADRGEKDNTIEALEAEVCVFRQRSEALATRASQEEREKVSALVALERRGMCVGEVEGALQRSTSKCLRQQAALKALADQVSRAGILLERVEEREQKMRCEAETSAEALEAQLKRETALLAESERSVADLRVKLQEAEKERDESRRLVLMMEEEREENEIRDRKKQTEREAEWKEEREKVEQTSERFRRDHQILQQRYEGLQESFKCLTETLQNNQQTPQPVLTETSSQTTAEFVETGKPDKDSHVQKANFPPTSCPASEPFTQTPKVRLGLVIRPLSSKPKRPRLLLRAPSRSFKTTASHEEAHQPALSKMISSMTDTEESWAPMGDGGSWKIERHDGWNNRLQVKPEEEGKAGNQLPILTDTELSRNPENQFLALSNPNPADGVLISEVPSLNAHTPCNPLLPVPPSFISSHDPATTTSIGFPFPFPLSNRKAHSKRFVEEESDQQKGKTVCHGPPSPQRSLQKSEGSFSPIIPIPSFRSLNASARAETDREKSLASSTKVEREEREEGGTLSAGHRQPDSRPAALNRRDAMPLPSTSLPSHLSQLGCRKTTQQQAGPSLEMPSHPQAQARPSLFVEAEGRNESPPLRSKSLLLPPRDPSPHAHFQEKPKAETTNWQGPPLNVRGDGGGEKDQMSCPSHLPEPHKLPFPFLPTQAYDSPTFRQLEIPFCHQTDLRHSSELERLVSSHCHALPPPLLGNNPTDHHLTRETHTESKSKSLPPPCNSKHGGPIIPLPELTPDIRPPRSPLPPSPSLDLGGKSRLSSLPPPRKSNPNVPSPLNTPSNHPPPASAVNLPESTLKVEEANEKRTERDPAPDLQSGRDHHFSSPSSPVSSVLIPPSTAGAPRERAAFIVLQHLEMVKKEIRSSFRARDREREEKDKAGKSPSPTKTRGPPTGYPPDSCSHVCETVLEALQEQLCEALSLSVPCPQNENEEADALNDEVNKETHKAKTRGSTKPGQESPSSPVCEVIDEFMRSRRERDRETQKSTPSLLQSLVPSAGRLVACQNNHLPLLGRLESGDADQLGQISESITANLFSFNYPNDLKKVEPAEDIVGGERKKGKEREDGEGISKESCAVGRVVGGKDQKAEGESYGSLSCFHLACTDSFPDYTAGSEADMMDESLLSPPRFDEQTKKVLSGLLSCLSPSRLLISSTSQKQKEKEGSLEDEKEVEGQLQGESADSEEAVVGTLSLPFQEKEEEEELRQEEERDAKLSEASEPFNHVAIRETARICLEVLQGRRREGDQSNVLGEPSETARKAEEGGSPSDRQASSFLSGACEKDTVPTLPENEHLKSAMVGQGKEKARKSTQADFVSNTTGGNDTRKETKCVVRVGKKEEEQRANEKLEEEQLDTVCIRELNERLHSLLRNVRRAPERLQRSMQMQAETLVKHRTFSPPVFFPPERDVSKERDNQSHLVVSDSLPISFPLSRTDTAAPLRPLSAFEKKTAKEREGMDENGDSHWGKDFEMTQQEDHRTLAHRRSFSAPLRPHASSRRGDPPEGGGSDTHPGLCTQWTEEEEEEQTPTSSDQSRSEIEIPPFSSSRSRRKPCQGKGQDHFSHLPALPPPLYSQGASQHRNLIPRDPIPIPIPPPSSSSAEKSQAHAAQAVQLFQEAHPTRTRPHSQPPEVPRGSAGPSVPSCGGGQIPSPPPAAAAGGETLPLPCPADEEAAPQAGTRKPPQWTSPPLAGCLPLPAEKEPKAPSRSKRERDRERGLSIRCQRSVRPSRSHRTTAIQILRSSRI
eukprot:Cvel_11228.t1-p1 / transcript=Cvel_11228.t1 / gene=Cvel_11228 / organism=Chromera_velia_CCMP2878 / gene_product=hypothetical protein / transcript_product=hypothetical protein / location=Cvel_scaffold699:1-7795(-) / protein_length=2250 / sequence_SO=supercontig / SO=protein_coding / is_pseudo=false